MLESIAIPIGRISLSMKLARKPGSGNPNAGFDVAGVGNVLREVMESKKLDYIVNEGDGASYWPKIDFHIRDCLDRTWQCATIQLDFSMPEKFDIEYTGEDNLRHRPVMIHRVVLGSLERFSLRFSLPVIYFL